MAAKVGFVGMRLAVLALAAATACDRGNDSFSVPPLTGGTKRFAIPTDGNVPDSGTALEWERFAIVGHGVVLDSRTGLEWTSRDHFQSLVWDDADRYCRELRQGERAGWRLPELGELQTLYDKHANQPCGHRWCRLDSAISLADPYVWSAWGPLPGIPTYLDFTSGTRFSPGPSVLRRVLCVRQPLRRRD